MELTEEEMRDLDEEIALEYELEIARNLKQAIEKENRSKMVNMEYRKMLEDMKEKESEIQEKKAGYR